MSVMLVAVIHGLYQRHKSAANVKLATNPNVKEKDLDKSVVLGNPHTGPPTPPPQTEMEAFGTDDIVVPRYQEISPM